MGNPEIRPERGTTWEIGGQVSGEGRFTSRGEAAVFQRDLRDAITWQRNAQGVALAINLPAAQVRGLEAGWRGVSAVGTNLSVQATLLDAKADALRLPGVPAAEAALTLSQEVRAFSGGADLWVASRTWRDRANLVVDPGRTLVGAHLGWEQEEWSATLAVRNLLGHTAAAVPANALDPSGPATVVPLADYLGFPLPGRTWLLALAWRPVTRPRALGSRSPKGATD
jgi:outer membrane receptor protein involved in Fe transport